MSAPADACTVSWRRRQQRFRHHARREAETRAMVAATYAHHSSTAADRNVGERTLLRVLAEMETLKEKVDKL